MADEQATREPHDRLTRLAAAARDAMLAHPEFNEETDRLFASVDDGDRGGFYTHGYKGPHELVYVLLMHIAALSRVGARLN